MRPLGMILIGFSLWLSPTPAWSGSPVDPSREARVRQALLSSPLPVQLLFLPSHALHLFEVGPAGIPAEHLALIEKTVRHSFRPKPVLDGIVEALVTNYNEQALDDLIRWFQSPRGRKIVEAETLAASPDGMAVLQTFPTQTKAEATSRERIRLMIHLDRVTRASETRVELSRSLLVSMIEAAQTVNPGVSKASSADVNALFDQQNARIEGAIQTQTVRANLFTYRDIETDDLRAYVAFLQSPAATWFRETANDAAEKRLAQAARQFATELASVLSNDPALYASDE